VWEADKKIREAVKKLEDADKTKNPTDMEYAQKLTDEAKKAYYLAEEKLEEWEKAQAIASDKRKEAEKAMKQAQEKLSDIFGK
jgi:hypothetical protein